MAQHRTRPAQWFRDSVKREQRLAAKDDHIGAQLEYARRESERQYLKDSIKTLRQYAHGFEAGDGYNLHDVAHLTGAKLAKVQKLAPLLRQELASSGKKVRAGDKARSAALEHYTGQDYLPHRKAYWVHMQRPEETRVSVRRYKERGGKAKKKGKRKLSPPTVKVLEKHKGGETETRLFLFSDYTKRKHLYTFEQIRNVVRKMLPFMPDGWYVTVSKSHGLISMPMQKHHLLEELADRFFAYDAVPTLSRKDNRGLAETVIGYQLSNFTVEGAGREYSERLSRRDKLRRFRAGQRADKQRRIRKRLRR